MSGNTMGVDLTPFRFSDALNGGPGAEIALTNAGRTTSPARRSIRA